MNEDRFLNENAPVILKCVAVHSKDPEGLLLFLLLLLLLFIVEQTEKYKMFVSK